MSFKSSSSISSLWSVREWSNVDNPWLYFFFRFFCDCGAGSLKSSCLLVDPVETGNDPDQIEPEINQTGNECSDKSDLPN